MDELVQGICGGTIQVIELDQCKTGRVMSKTDLPIYRNFIEPIKYF